MLNALKQPGVNDVVAFTFYPVGGFTNPGINKSVSCPTTQGQASFDLPDKDCQSDKYEACLMNVSGCAEYTCSPTKQLGLSKFLDCFEGNDGSSPADADGCATAAGFDPTRIHSCYDHAAVRDSVWKRLQQATSKKRPTLTCFPWVEVDGEVLTDNCFGPIAKTWPLLAALCNRTKVAGIPPPAACASASTLMV